jgi:hypothetical protein
MSLRETVEEFGGTYFQPLEAPYYRVGADCTKGDRKGSSVSFGEEFATPEEAQAGLDRKRAIPEEACDYDTWYVVETVPGARTRIVPGSERTEKTDG